MGICGTIWDYLGQSRTIWDSMVLSGTIWTYLGLSGVNHIQAFADRVGRPQKSAILLTLADWGGGWDGRWGEPKVADTKGYFG